MTRSFLRNVCRALIGVVMLAQLAVSAYACPMLSSRSGADPTPPAASSQTIDDRSSSASNTAAANMTAAATTMDDSFGNLCIEHCRHGQQSDVAAPLGVPPSSAVALYVTPPASLPAIGPHVAADTIGALAAASTSLAILHCCFRI